MDYVACLQALESTKQFYWWLTCAAARVWLTSTGEGKQHVLVHAASFDPVNLSNDVPQ